MSTYGVAPKSTVLINDLKVIGKIKLIKNYQENIAHVKLPRVTISQRITPNDQTSHLGAC